MDAFAENFTRPVVPPWVVTEYVTHPLIVPVFHFTPVRPELGSDFTDSKPWLGEEPTTGQLPMPSTQFERSCPDTSQTSYVQVFDPSGCVVTVFRSTVLPFSVDVGGELSATVLPEPESPPVPEPDSVPEPVLDDPSDVPPEPGPQMSPEGVRPSEHSGVVRVQSGYLYHYAFAMLIGVAAFITFYLFRGAH